MMSAILQVAEVITSVAIGVLAAIFITAFILLVIIIHRRSKYLKSYMSTTTKYYDNFTDPDICPSAIVNQSELYPPESYVEQEQFEQILSNKDFIDDATGLIPHCLEILKQCRSLTERLTALAMGNITEGEPTLKQVVKIAKQISSRVDELVGSMYPPLNAQLLEAKAASLTLAVTHLAIITQYQCKNKKIPMDWIQKGLKEMENHINDVLLQDLFLTCKVVGPFPALIFFPSHIWKLRNDGICKLHILLRRSFPIQGQ